MVPKKLEEKLTTAVDDYMERLYKSHLKTIQLNYHLCAAECYKSVSSNSSYSDEECKSKCAEKLGRARGRVYTDVNNMQSRFEACSESCRSTYNLGAKSRPEEETKMAAEEKYVCLSKCTEDVLELFPKTLKNAQDFLDSNQ